MKRRKYNFVMSLLAALLASAFVLPAASASGITFGVLTPLTGTNSVQGQDILKGIKLAVDRVNNGYEVPMKGGKTMKIGPGVLGGKIKLKIEDDESRPQSAVAGAHKLVDTDHVPVVVGGFSSGVAVPTGQFFNKSKTIDISAGATSPKLRGIGPYFFDTIGLDSLMGKAIGKFLMEDSGAKTVASITPNNPFGIGIEQEACKQIKKMGGKCTTKVHYQQHKNDYRAEIHSLMHSHPGAILFTAYGTDSKLILKQAYQLGFTSHKHWYADYMTMWSNEVSSQPKTANGIKGLVPGKKTQFLETHYAQPFEKKYGHKPATSFSAYAYDSVMLAALAVNKAGSADPDAIKKALHEVSKNYEGVMGNEAFDKNGMQKTNLYTKKIYRKGKLENYSASK